MKAEKIYIRALSFLMEEPGEDKVFLKNAPELINSALSIAKNTLIGRRAAQGADEFSYTPVVTLEDEVPIDRDEANALALYLAAEFFRDDNNESAYREFSGRFKDALRDIAHFVICEVDDVYGGQHFEV